MRSGRTLFRPGPGAADQEREKVAIKLILDTDIGTDVDDAWALALCLAGVYAALHMPSASAPAPRRCISHCSHWASARATR